MAEQSGFFDSIDNDRVYASNWLAGYIAAIISNGVYNLELAVIANDNMSVKVEPGRAWINGYFYKNIGDFNLSIDIADGVTHRKDIVVLRFDINKRAINLQVVKGEFSGTPVAPEVTRNAEVYDLELCEISIPAGATKITQSMITDKRLDKNLCGIVHGVVEQIDTTTLLKQMEDWFERFKQSAQGDLDNLEAEFDQWFETIKGKLSEDVAGSLQNQIDTKVSKTGDTMTGDLELSNPNTTLKHKLIIGNNDSGYASIYAHDSDGGYSDLMIYAKRFYFPNQILVDNIATPTSDHHAATKKYVDDNAGKRTCRFVVGTSTAGWTKKDCDYLCDGTDDQVEIQAAINALPSTGGEVVVLDGTYHITASINVNKNNVTLRGCGASTVLKNTGIKVGNTLLGCASSFNTIKNLHIIGSESIYDSNMIGIAVTGAKTYDFTITNNICEDCSIGILAGNSSGGTDSNPIRFTISNNISKNNTTGIKVYFFCTVIGNICYKNSIGIYVDRSQNSLVGNILSDNTDSGIYVRHGINSVVSSNVLAGNENGIYVYYCESSVFIGNSIDKETYSPSKYSIIIRGNNNLIANNMIWGKNYTNSGTGNTFVNNKYN